MWKIKKDGSSGTTILAKDGVPVARFYSGRFDQQMLDKIEKALNAVGA